MSVCHKSNKAIPRITVERLVWHYKVTYETQLGLLQKKSFQYPACDDTNSEMVLRVRDLYTEGDPCERERGKNFLVRLTL